MSKLTFKKGKPIALIKKGKYNGKKLNLVVETFDNIMDNNSDSEDEVKNDPTDLIDIAEVMKILKSSKKSGPKDMKNLIMSIKGTKIAEEDNIRNLGNIYKNKIDDFNKKELIIHDGFMYPILEQKRANRLYVVGPSMSGKTTYVSNLLKVNCPKKLYLFSDVDQDPLLDKFKPIRIKLDMELVENPIKSSELSNSLVIFDDIDAIQDKKIAKAVFALRDSLLTRGRHDGVSVICTNHIATAGNETKKILNECTAITIFPKSGISYDYLLTRYCALSKPQINKIKSLPSRWVTILKSYPMVVIYSQGTYLL